MKATAIVAGLVMFSAATVLSIFAQGKDGEPGIFGRGVAIGDVNLALEIVLVLGLTAGAWLARRGRIEAHRVNQVDAPDARRLLDGCAARNRALFPVVCQLRILRSVEPLCLRRCGASLSSRGCPARGGHSTHE